ncbi:hypothetical protein [Candidatus Palauibacter sp.]|uniref:hypothetical protein n=1 Tax=Candidatus Palauibacter sp. TaxID=3101350 RepID=UPI003C6F7FCD
MLKEKIPKRGAGLGLAVALWKGADALWGIASLMSALEWWVVLAVTSGAMLVGPETVRFARSVPGRLRDGQLARPSETKPVRDASTFERRERQGKPYWVAPDGRRWVLPDDMAQDLAYRSPVATLERHTRSSKIDPENMLPIKSARRALADGLVARFVVENPEGTAGDLVDAVALERWVKSYILEKIEASGRSVDLGGRMGDGLN